MNLKAVKQIEELVNEFNQIRLERNRLPLAVSTDEYDKDKWSVEISIPFNGTLYSRECSVLFPLLSQLDCTYFIGLVIPDCTIFIQ